jgi:rod shape-determining protein MreC
VTLLTDEQSAVTATDVTNPTTTGVVRRGSGDSNVLILDRVPKSKAVRVGDTIITAGSLGNGDLPSMFPRGVPIGTVNYVGNSDVNAFKNVEVAPLVDFSSLQSVVVLVPKR